VTFSWQWTELVFTSFVWLFSVFWFWGPTSQSKKHPLILTNGLCTDEKLAPWQGQDLCLLTNKGGVPSTHIMLDSRSLCQ
jgi:hypothetical protein